MVSRTSSLFWPNQIKELSLMQHWKFGMRWNHFNVSTALTALRLLINYCHSKYQYITFFCTYIFVKCQVFYCNNEIVKNALKYCRINVNAVLPSLVLGILVQLVFFTRSMYIGRHASQNTIHRILIKPQNENVGVVGTRKK